MTQTEKKQKTIDRMISRMVSMRRRLAISAALLGGAVALFFAVSAIVLHFFVVPAVVAKKHEIEIAASKALKRPVTIASIEGGWRYVRPMLTIENVDGGEDLSIKRVTAVISYMSVLKLEPVLAYLEVEDPKLSARRDADGKLFVAGIPVDTGSDDSSMLDKLLDQREIVVKGGVMDVTDEKRGFSATLRKVNMSLEKGWASHDFRFSAEMPGAFSYFSLSGEMTGGLFGASGPLGERIRSLDSSLNGADFGKISALLGVDVGPVKGIADADITAELYKGKLQAASVIVDGHDLLIRMPNDGPELSFKKLLADARLDISQRERKQYLAISRLQATLGTGEVLSEFNGSISGFADENGRIKKMAVSAERINLGEAHTFVLGLPVPENVKKPLSAVTVSGKVEDAYLSLVFDGSGEWHAKATVDSVTVKKRPGVKLPDDLAFLETSGIENLSGEFDMRPARGTVRIDSKNTVITTPIYAADNPLRADSLAASILWTRSAGNLEVNIEKVVFKTGPTEISAQGMYTKGPASYGDIDLEVTVNGLPATDVKKYIPLAAPKDLKDWLTGSLQGGTVNECTAVIKGPVDQIPFDSPDAEGVFKVRAPISDGVLNYTPGMFSKDGKRPYWPVIHKIEGFFEMDKGSILIHADTAEMVGVPAKDIDVKIADAIDRPELDIHGTVKAPMQDMIGYVNVSPVYDVISGFTEEVKATGEAELDLSIYLPLAHMDKAKVAGKVVFPGNDIVLFEDMPVITKATGELTFSEKGFDIPAIRGVFLGEPVEVTGGTKDDGKFHVKARGTLSATGLKRTYTSGVMKYLVSLTDGATPFYVDVDNAGVTVSSSLKGLGIRLLEPLGKKAAETRNLSVKVRSNPASKNRDTMTVAYGPNVDVKYNREKRGRKWAVASAGFGINTPAVAKPGLLASAKFQKVNVDDWIDEIARIAAAGGVSGGTSSRASSSGAGLAGYLVPHHFRVDSREMLYAGMWFKNATVAGQQHMPVISLNISTDQVKGNVKYDFAVQPEGRISGRFSKLSIDKTMLQKGDQKASAVSQKQANISDVDVKIDRFTVYGMNLGAVDLLAENVKKGAGYEWVIRRAKVTSPDSTFSATGSWQHTDGNGKTDAQFTLKINDAGKFLKRLGYSDLVKNGNGTISGNLSWRDYPFNPHYSSLSGDVKAEIKSGAFLKADPGAARLLGIASFQSIFSRLSLDFRDLVEEGYAFKEITMNGEVSDGVMKTKNLKIEGVTASVLIEGKVDIPHESLNFDVTIIPQIDAGAASLAYGFINPAIGIGTFVAQMFLKNPLMNELAMKYHVGGTMDKPQVTKISGKRKKRGKGEAAEKEQAAPAAAS